MEMDGVGLELVYGQQSGNAGQFGGTNYNDLDETSYSAKLLMETLLQTTKK